MKYGREIKQYAVDIFVRIQARKRYLFLYFI